MLDKFWDILNGITAFVAIQGVVVGITDWSRLKNDTQAIVVALACATLLCPRFT